MNISDTSLKYVASYCLMLRELSISDCSRKVGHIETKLILFKFRHYNEILELNWNFLIKKLK